MYRSVRLAALASLVLTGVLSASPSLASGCAWYGPGYVPRAAKTIFSGVVRSVGEPIRGEWTYVVPNTIEVTRVYRGNIGDAVVEVHTLPPLNWLPPPDSRQPSIAIGMTSADIRVRFRPGEHVILALVGEKPPFALTDNCGAVLTLGELIFVARYPMAAPALVIVIVLATITVMVLLLRTQRLTRRARGIAALFILVVGVLLVIRLLPYVSAFLWHAWIRNRS